MHSADAPGILEHWRHKVDFRPHGVAWVPSSARFAVAGGRFNDTGVIAVYELGVAEDNSPAPTMEVDLPAALHCVTFAGGGSSRALAVGDMRGGVTML